MTDISSAARTSQRRAIAFGFGAALISSAGQSYFIGLFGGALSTAFELDAAGFGALYALATLASGAAMFWLGGMADHLRLRSSLYLAQSALIPGAALLALASASWMLLPALFLLRLGGQGLCGHLAIVAALRYGGVRQGRGVSLAAFGFIASEALLPLLIINLLQVADWRSLWVGIVVALLLATLLLGRLAERIEERPAGEQSNQPQLRRRLLLRTPAFLAALCVVLLPAFCVTAVFLHQHALAARFGWTVSWLPAAFALFALTQGLANFVGGWAVDRLGVLPVLRVYLIPLAGALGVLSLLPELPGQLLSFALFGLTSGVQGVLGGALWAWLFGPRQVGLVRGVYAAGMVLATALSPWLLGSLLDGSEALEALALCLALYALVTPWLIGPLLRRQAAATRSALEVSAARIMRPAEAGPTRAQ